MNYSTLEPYSYTRPLRNYNDMPEWDGQRSSKFAKTIRFSPAKDLIKTNFDLPDQTPKRGRVHFYQPSSIEKPVRPQLHKVPPINHWHLRQSKIRTMDFKPIEHHPRCQKKHNNQLVHNPQKMRPESLRTIYKTGWETNREYSVQNRMQQKIRIDQAQLRQTYFKGINIFKK